MRIEFLSSFHSQLVSLAEYIIILFLSWKDFLFYCGEDKKDSFKEVI